MNQFINQQWRRINVSCHQISKRFDVPVPDNMKVQAGQPYQRMRERTIALADFLEKIATKADEVKADEASDEVVAKADEAKADEASDEVVAKADEAKADEAKANEASDEVVAKADEVKAKPKRSTRKSK